MGDDNHFYVIGGVCGLASGVFGVLFYNLAESKKKETVYLHNSPTYRTFGSDLRNLLKASHKSEANVLLEGTVEKIDDLKVTSNDVGISGAGRIVTTLYSSKVRVDVQHEKRNRRRYKRRKRVAQWNDVSRVIENTRISVPFNLKGKDGHTIRVENAHLADNFQSSLTMVYNDVDHYSQPILPAREYPVGYEVPVSKHVTELLLCFGAPFAAYGKAMIPSTQPEIIFTPTDIGKSVNDIIYRKEFVAGVYRVLAWMCFAGLGGCILFALVPKLWKFLQPNQQRNDNKKYAMCN